MIYMGNEFYRLDWRPRGQDWSYRTTPRTISQEPLEEFRLRKQEQLERKSGIPEYWKNMFQQGWMIIETTNFRYHLLEKRDKVPKEAREIVDALANEGRYIFDPNSRLVLSPSFPDCIRPIFSQINRRLLEFLIAFKGQDLMLEHSDSVGYPEKAFAFLGKVAPPYAGGASWWLKIPSR
jgi:hypothetical protein